MRKLVKIIVPILLLGFIIYGLDWFAVINVNKMLSKVPIIKNVISHDKSTGQNVSSKVSTSVTEKSPTEKENLNLKKQVIDLKKQVDELKKSNDSLKASKDEAVTNLQNIENTQKDKTSKASGYKQLANYYANMKPAEAVKIMNNLDDETIIGILINLENEQAGKILAAMDPKRAAIIVSKMT